MRTFRGKNDSLSFPAFAQNGPSRDDALEPGMVLRVIPALRTPGVGGAGFSATVLVTSDGHKVPTRL